MFGSSHGKVHGNKATLTNTAYGMIKKMIIKHELVPGEVLSENILADSLQMSRTPIREALKMLQMDDLVVAVHGSGTYVKDVSEKELRDLFAVRIALECLSAETAVNFVDNQLIDELLKEWEALTDIDNTSEIDWEQIAAADNQLHNMIVHKSHNDVLRHIYAILNSKIIRYQHLSALSLGNLSDTVAQHIELLKFLQQKDVTNLRLSLKDHINLSLENIIRKL